MVVVVQSADGVENSSIVITDKKEKYSRERARESAKAIFDILYDKLSVGTFDELSSLFENARDEIVLINK